MRANKVITIMPCVPSLGEKCRKLSRYVPRTKVLSDSSPLYDSETSGLRRWLLPYPGQGPKASATLLLLRFALGALLLAGCVLVIINGGATSVRHPAIWSVCGLLGAALFFVGFAVRPVAISLTVFLVFSTEIFAGATTIVVGVAALMTSVLAVFGPGSYSLDSQLMRRVRRR